MKKKTDPRRVRMSLALSEREETEVRARAEAFGISMTELFIRGALALKGKQQAQEVIEL